MLLRSHCCYYLSIINVLAMFLATMSFANAQFCNGILVSYAYTVDVRLPSNVFDPAKEPYQFESTVTVLNNDLDKLKSWEVFVGYDQDELLVSASNVLLADDTTLPIAVEKDRRRNHRQLDPDVDRTCRHHVRGGINQCFNAEIHQPRQ